ncbi:MAG TPA: D-arabinono-1,4-lactone oxidase [Solimonas sp.]|nr:D-arabinono-1,4-lactone oxidase [Solimonas sp.]
MALRRTRKWQNWSGSVSCEPAHCSYPLGIEEVQSEVLRCNEEGERLRMIGSGHSFSPLCASDENQLSLRDFTGIESADLERRRVWVRAGTTLQELGGLLSERGLALENLGDIDVQTVAGAISTGTHGSGLGFGSLSTLVTGLQMVGADGTVRRLSQAEHPEIFDAARLSLGALGVITHVELQCVDAYRLHRQDLRAPLEETLARLDEYLHGYRNFEFYWFPYSETVHLRFMDTTQRPARSWPSLRSAGEMAMQNGVFWGVSEMVRRMPALSERVSRFAAQRTPISESIREAHRGYATPRLVRSNQTEYSIPLDRLPMVIRQIDRLISALRFRVYFPLHVSFVREDNIWLSPSYQRPSACVAVHTYRGMPNEDYFAAVTEIFDRNDGRPHWGKQHDKTAHELRSLYPRFEDFRRLRQEMDPRGVFLNPHLATIFGIEGR